MHSVPDASAAILAKIGVLDEESVPLADLAGRAITNPITAPFAVPAWNNAGMDGYGVRAADIANASAVSPVTLPVSGSVAAGGSPSGPLAAGTAVRVMTGAPVPDGTDTVIRVEDTDGNTARVSIVNARDAMKNVRRRGEDFREGDELLAAGTAIGPAVIGVLASIGAAQLRVPRRPRVAFLASGDEIVELDRMAEVKAGKKIFTSNSYALAALITANGGVPVNLGIARDEPADIKARLLRARDERADLILTTAGISAGEHDYVRTVLDELGLTLDVWKVRLRPGAPLGFGMLGAVPWIGLPGNPVSTMVTFELFVRPAMRKMLGHRLLHRRPMPVTVEEEITTGAKLTHFMRAVVTIAPDGTRTARLTGPQGSGILTSMTRANALIIVPEDRPHVRPGEQLNAILLNENGLLDAQFAL
jgi:molybdopterin molybdotransferase